MLKKKEEKEMSELSKPKHPGGRPSKYTPELARQICKLVAVTPLGLRKLCLMHDWMPHQDTIREWRFDYPEFSALYTQAKVQQADILVEDCLDIADDTREDITIDEHGNEKINFEIVARSRLKIDTRKFMGIKLLPKVYGDEKELQDTRIQNELLKEELMKLRMQLDEKNKKDY